MSSEPMLPICLPKRLFLHFSAFYSLFRSRRHTSPSHRVVSLSRLVISASRPLFIQPSDHFHFTSPPDISYSSLADALSLRCHVVTHRLANTSRRHVTLRLSALSLFGLLFHHIFPLPHCATLLPFKMPHSALLQFVLFRHSRFVAPLASLGDREVVSNLY